MPSWACKEGLWADKSQVCNSNKTLLSKVWRQTLALVFATVLLRALYVYYTSKIKGVGFCCLAMYREWFLLEKKITSPTIENKRQRNCNSSHCSRFNQILTFVLRITYLWPLTMLLYVSPKLLLRTELKFPIFLWHLPLKVPPHYWPSLSKLETLPFKWHNALLVFVALVFRCIISLGPCETTILTNLSF